MEPEIQIILDGSPLRQGDVFSWEGNARRRPWDNFGVIVTADCDLVQNKTYGRLSYVPLLSFEDYMWFFWRPRAFQSLLDDLERTVTQRLSKILKRQNPQHSGLSIEATRMWIARAGEAGIVSELGLQDRGQIKDLTDLIRKYKTIFSLLKTESPDANLLLTSFKIKHATMSGPGHEELAAEFQKNVSSLPGDVFFLSGIEGHEVHGMFAMLRFISQCGLEDVAVNRDEVEFGEAKAKRIGRLQAPYLYSLTQNLARVFSDVGLPREYAERRKLTPASYVTSCYKLGGK